MDVSQALTLDILPFILAIAYKGSETDPDYAKEHILLTAHGFHPDLSVMY